MGGSAQHSHYDTLQVRPAADADAVRRAYRQQARQWHPDRMPDDAAAQQRMADINAAYAVLSHPGLRAGYDRWLQARGARVAAERAVDEARPSGFAQAWPWWLLCATLCFSTLSIGTVLYKMAVPPVAVPAQGKR